MARVHLIWEGSEQVEVTWGDQGIAYMFSFGFFLLSSEQISDIGIRILGTVEKFSNLL